jgi:hypothetical protein
MDLVHGLPQAGRVLALVFNWWSETALAERTAANIAANNIFFTIYAPCFISFRQRRRGAFRLANAVRVCVSQAKTITWLLTVEIGATASASAGKD